MRREKSNWQLDLPYGSLHAPTLRPEVCESPCIFKLIQNTIHFNKKIAIIIVNNTQLLTLLLQFFQISLKNPESFKKM